MSARKKRLWRELAESRQWAQHYHRALWDEERHYSWWISIILPALAIVYATPNLTVLVKQAVVTAGAAVGLILALAAQHVVRIEGRNYIKAMWRHDALVRLLELDSPRDVPGLGRTSLYEAGFVGIANHRRAVLDGDRLVRGRGGVLHVRIGIRSSFRLTFWFFVPVYAAIITCIWLFPPGLIPLSTSMPPR